jgi:HME family heavy-metal exporter
MATLLPRAFLPPFNEGSFTVNLLFNPGISLAESHRVGLIAERLILEVPEVAAVGRRTGRAELDEHAEGVHSSEIEIALKPGGRSKNDIVQDIRGRLAALPVLTNVGQPISHRLDHMLSGVRAQIALKIFGEDLSTIRAVAEQMRGRLAEIPGIVDLQVEKQVLIPQLELRVDYARAALYGVQPAAVTEQLERLSNGRVVSRLVDGNRRFDVVVRLPDRLRTTQGLGDLLIETPSGWIPLRQIADIVETDGPNQILRENQKRRVVVLANAEGDSDMAAIIARIRASLAASELPQGVFTVLEGTKWKSRVPSPTGIGIGMLVPTSAIVTMFLGGLTALLWNRSAPKQADKHLVPLASGFIAGEAIVAVVIPILVALRFVHLQP